MLQNDDRSCCLNGELAYTVPPGTIDPSGLGHT